MLDSYLARLIEPVVVDVLGRFDPQPGTPLGDKIIAMEARMSSLEAQANEQLGLVIGLAIAELTSLREGNKIKDQALVDANATIESLKATIEAQSGQLAQAEADKIAAVQQAVADALATDSDADAQRALGYVDQLNSALPQVVVPDVPVSEPGVPAEAPSDAGTAVSIPEVEPAETPEPSEVAITEPLDVAPTGDGSTDTI